MASCRFGVMRRLERVIQRFFYLLGHFIGSYPWPNILLPLILTAALSTGLMRFQEINDIHEFTPMNSDSRYESAVAQQFLGTKGRLSRLILLIQAADGGSLLRLQHIDSVLQLVEHLEVDVGVHSRQYGRYTFADFCTPYCDTNRPLVGFLTAYNETLVNPHQAANPNLRLAYPITSVLDQEMYVANNLHAVTLNGRGVVTSAKLFSLTFFAYLHSDEAERRFHAWEERVFDLFQDHSPYPLLRTLVNSESFVSSEVKRVGVRAMPLLALTMVITVCFTVLTSFRTGVRRSKPLEAFIGTMTPLLAIVATIGSLLLIGLHWQPIVTLTLFLVVAVGVDDVFIILHAWHLSPAGLPVAQRMGLTLQEAGPSITITSVTNALSFSIGVFCGTPAIVTFSIYSMVAVMFSYVFQLFIFSAVLCLCGRREGQKASCYGCCAADVCTVDDLPTKAVSDEHDDENTSVCSWTFAGAFFDHLSAFLVSALGRVLILTALVCYWALAIYGFTLMKVELNINKLVADDSAVVKFNSLHSKYMLGELDQLMVFVHNPGNLHSQTRRDRLLQMVGDFESADRSYGRPSTILWYTAYRLHLSYFGGDGHFTYQRLPGWLKSSAAASYKPQLRVDADSCERDEPQCIRAFFLLTSFRGMFDIRDRMTAVAEWRRIARRYDEFNVTVFEDENFFVDQASSMERTTLTAVVGALGGVSVVCLLLIPHLLSVFCAALSVLSINVGVFGGLALWSVDLDPITMAAMLMAVGFSVDFTAHISYHYFKGEQAQLPVERLRRAFGSVGWPMSQAGASTLLAVAVLPFSDAYMVSVFVKAVVLVVLIGLLHGLVVLPVILALMPCQDAVDGGDSSTPSVDGGETASSVASSAEDGSSASGSSASPKSDPLSRRRHVLPPLPAAKDIENTPADAKKDIVRQHSFSKRVLNKRNAVGPMPPLRRSRSMGPTKIDGTRLATIS